MFPSPHQRWVHGPVSVSAPLLAAVPSLCVCRHPDLGPALGDVPAAPPQCPPCSSPASSGSPRSPSFLSGETTRRLVYAEPVLCPASRFLPKASPVLLHRPALPSVPAAAAPDGAWGKDSALKITRSPSQNAEMSLYRVLPAGAALGSVPRPAPSPRGGTGPALPGLPPC